MIHPEVVKFCREVIADDLAHMVTFPLPDCILATQSHVRDRLHDISYQLEGAQASAYYYRRPDDGARLAVFTMRAIKLATSRYTEDSNAA